MLMSTHLTLFQLSGIRLDILQSLTAVLLSIDSQSSSHDTRLSAVGLGCNCLSKWMGRSPGGTQIPFPVLCPFEGRSPCLHWMDLEQHILLIHFVKGWELSLGRKIQVDRGSLEFTGGKKEGEMCYFFTSVQQNVLPGTPGPDVVTWL